MKLLDDGFPSCICGLGVKPCCIMSVEVAHDVAIGESIQVL